MAARSTADILGDLDRLQKRREVLIDQLRLWVEVIAQGIDRNDVESFGWDESLLTSDQKAAINWWKTRPLWAGEWRLNCGRPLWFNFVRLTSGEVRRLSPILQVARELP